MSSEAEQTQIARVINTLTEFVRILVKEYPLVFKNGSGEIEVHPSTQPLFPYEVSLEIKKKDILDSKKK
jgi:hypothetical protein